MSNDIQTGKLPVSNISTSSQKAGNQPGQSAQKAGSQY